MLFALYTVHCTLLLCGLFCHNFTLLHFRGQNAAMDMDDSSEFCVVRAPVEASSPSTSATVAKASSTSSDNRSSSSSSSSDSSSSTSAVMSAKLECRLDGP